MTTLIGVVSGVISGLAFAAIVAATWWLNRAGLEAIDVDERLVPTPAGVR